MDDIIDIETDTALASSIGLKPNVIEDRNNGISHPTTRMRTIDPIHCLVRMNVRPFYPFRTYRIIPYHSQKCADQLFLPLSSVSLSPSYGNSCHHPQRNDEWRSIWQRLHIFMAQDTVLTEHHKLEKLILLLLTIMIILILTLYMGYNVDETIHTIVFCAIALFTVVFVIHTYVRYGDPSYRLGSISKLPQISYIAKCSPVVVVLCIILVSLMHTDSEWFLYYVLAVFVLVFVLFGIMYVLCVSCCIPILISCRNQFYYKLDRNNKILKNIYYEIKDINNGLHYFALHPRVSFENSSIVVDVHYKIAASDNHGDGIDGIESPTLSTSLPLQMLSVTQRQGGIDGDGPGGSDDI